MHIVHLKECNTHDQKLCTTQAKTMASILSQEQNCKLNTVTE